jgi:hypothetical protein
VPAGSAVERIEKERLEVSSQANLAIATGPALGTNWQRKKRKKGVSVLAMEQMFYIVDVFYMLKKLPVDLQH